MKFYIIIDDKQAGPFSIDELNVRGLKPDTPVWAEGMSDWALASEVPALESAVIRGPQSGPVPPYYQGPQQQPDGGQQPPLWQPPYQPAEPQPKPRSNKPWIITAILVLILALLVFSCPDNADHQNAVKSEVRAFVNESIDGNTPSDGLLGSILSLGQKCISGVALDSFIESSFRTDNYIVCSVGRIEFMGKDKVVSFGILGHVFTFSKEDLALSLERAIGGNVDSKQPVKKAEKLDESASNESESKAEQKAEDKITNDVDSAAHRLVDSVGQRIKKKATKAATDWLKKQVDKLNE